MSRAIAGAALAATILVLGGVHTARAQDAGGETARPAGRQAADGADAVEAIEEGLRDAYATATGADRTAAGRALAEHLSARRLHLGAAAVWREIREAAPTAPHALAEATSLLAFAEQVLAGGGAGAGIRAAYEDAKLAFLRSRELGATGIEVPLGLARCAAAQGDQVAELDELRGARTAFPDNPVVQRALGFAYLNSGMHPESIAELRPLSDAAPDDLVLARALAHSAHAAGDEPLALSAANRAIDAAPESPDAWQSLWGVFSGENRWGELATAVLAAADRHPDGVASAHYAGFALAAAQKPDAALAWLKRAWERKPDNLAAKLKAARIYLTHKRDDDAAAALFRDVLLADATNADALAGLSYLAVRLGNELRHEDAIPHFEALAAAQPEDGLAQANLALALRWAGRHDAAVAAYERAVAATPYDAQIRNDYGLLLLVMGRDDAARAVFIAAHEVDDLANDCVENLGFMAREKGDLEEAQAWFGMAWDAALRRGNPDLLQRHRRNLDDVRFPLPPLR